MSRSSKIELLYFCVLIESLAGYAYDEKHNGRHTDGKHDDLYPHGTKHAKHDKDATFAYQIVETDRTFTYDAAGKLVSATETEDNYGTYIYTYEYDLMGNRTYMEKTLNGTVAEWHKYEYNESNQLVSEQLYNGKKTTSLAYTYDADGNRITETGKVGTDKVEKTYEYTVENRLAAVHDGDELLLAAAYDGDGNRVFLLNYNLHTDDDWKGNSGNGNGNNKDNSGSGNNGKGNSGNNGNGNGNGKGKGNNKKNSKSGGTDDAGYGNATNAEENNSQNQCGILFPVQEEVSATEADLIARIKTTGKEKNYELIEYLNDVNREHAEVLVEQNINGRTDTLYIYGAEINGGFDRISLDRFDGSTGYYLYDARGSVSGVTNEEGQVYQSYRYSVTGEITFGAPQYENEYTYNGESYNPNIESQYLRARYYCVVTAVFLTEDSCLGSLTEPLTLNRYNYCVSSYLNYTDPSGNSTENDVDRILREYPILSNQKSEQAIAVESFVNGVLGSAAKVIIDKPTAAYMPGMAMEELYGGQYRFNERAYNNYVNLTETLIEALSKDATNKTAYYAGRCTGDVVITAVGGVEFVYGLITTISGGSGSAAALATGIGIAAEPVTIAVTAEGVVTVVDGVNTIHYGITAFKKDADKGKEAKEADSKAAESGLNSNLLDELANSGVKYNPEDIVAITKTADGKLVWLENGTDTAGLNHIITEHADDFLNKGITQEQIPDYVMNALENGKIVGYQGRGTGRPIYEFTYNGEIHKVAITVGNNGFIVGANPK